MEPPPATPAKGLSLGKEKESVRKTVANVVQVWWDRVYPAAETHVVGEVELTAQRPRSDGSMLANSRRGME